ncbi:DUF4030 domain-containing protein [Fictibacillus arsenicus]|uniref:DUF4179 domain-containing protein n=1 Tax=Fictibacillus arsenicus TaxID=255247 RepID=A0A1V3GE90_9BACL|nr:DUF4030 domain-containing protein [Fictibacillus arsenicus]OOE14721.1 hypothetical protein UN64_05905 [Fictibacillus arsenicus]
MEDKLKKLRGSMTNTVLSDVTFDQNLERKIHDRIERRSFTSKRNHLGKRFMYLTAAAVLLFALFIGSAFVSPAMAKMAAKIPYLGQYFESENIGYVIHEKLKEERYQISGVGASYQGKKEIFIDIQGDDQYFEKVKNEVQSLAAEILKSRGYDAYSVKVGKYQERILSEEDKKFMQEQEKQAEQDENILTAINKKREEYQLEGLGIDSNKKIIEMEVPNTVERTDEMKQQVQKIVSAHTNESYTIKIKKINMKKRDQDWRWGQILTMVGEDLMGKKVYKVTGLAYSVYPSPEIIFKTSLKSTDPDSKEHAEQLEKVIEDYLKTDEMKEKVKGDSYTITIRSKDQKKLN